MHSYLRSIGFSNISRKEWKEIVEETIRNYDEKQMAGQEKEVIFSEMSKSFGYDMGITVCGEYDEDNEFLMEYAYPYFRGTGIATREDVLIERRTEKECYSGACDDARLGVTLIFYLANAGKYLNEKYKNTLSDCITTLTLSALSLEGKILLPIQKNMSEVESAQKNRRKRVELIQEARNGDEEAMESLTIDDMDIYSALSRRIQEEDILSIVETYFMPYGMECDRYHILGEIMDVSKVQNTYTGELVYQMTVNCNDIEFDVCINQQDLLGEPAVGRRFKGIVWLQGILNFM